MRLTIERLGHLGDGLAVGPDGPVRVALALPGETVEGEVAEGRMAAPAIVAPSPDRVRAPRSTTSLAKQGCRPPR